MMNDRQFISSLVTTIPQLQRGKVWCTVCGKSQSVNSGQALQSGWPRCCGYTMTIDSPEERRRFAKEPPK